MPVCLLGRHRSSQGIPKQTRKQKDEDLERSYDANIIGWDKREDSLRRLGLAHEL